MSPVSSVLLTCVRMDHRSGAIISTVDIALELRRRGIEVAVYSPMPGIMSDALVAAGVPFAADVSKIELEPDVIHGCHHVETVETLLRFPSTPAVFVCRDPESWIDEPPVHPSILRYVAIDRACEGRLMRSPGVRPETLQTIRHGFDLDQLPRRSPLPPRPQRALVYSNTATKDGWARPLLAACERERIGVDIVGMASSNATSTPGDVLPHYDIVFAKGRSAFEAAACGAFVISCDGMGLGPALTPENIAEVWEWNAGHHVLRGPLTAEAVRDELRRYDPQGAAVVTEFVREKTLACSVDAWQALYDEAVREPLTVCPDQVTRATLRAFQVEREGAALVLNDAHRVFAEYLATVTAPRAQGTLPGLGRLTRLAARLRARRRGA